MKASCIFIFLAAFPRICARAFELEFNERARGLHINEEGRRVQSGNTVKVFSLWAFASACSFFFFLLLLHHLPPRIRTAGAVSVATDRNARLSATPRAPGVFAM